MPYEILRRKVQIWKFSFKKRRHCHYSRRPILCCTVAISDAKDASDQIWQWRMHVVSRSRMSERENGRVENERKNGRVENERKNGRAENEWKNEKTSKRVSDIAQCSFACVRLAVDIVEFRSEFVICVTGSIKINIVLKIS